MSDSDSSSVASGEGGATSGSLPEFSFVAEDTTTSVKSEHRFFVLPTGVKLVGWFSIPHPRHGQLSSFAAGIRNSQLIVLESQQWSPLFSSWFVENFVEPRGSLAVLTEFDVTFFAIRIAIGKLSLREEIDAQVSSPGTSTGSFRDIDDLLLEVPEVLISTFTMLSPAGRPHEALDFSLRTICDVRVGDEKRYYRLNINRTLVWAASRVRRLQALEAFRKLVTGDDSKSGEAEQVIERKALAVVCDYLPMEFTEPLAAHCHIILSTTKAASNFTSAGSSAQPSLGRVEAKPSGPVKSANVKRLEKAGPPVGTPTLAGFFKPRPKS